MFGYKEDSKVQQWLVVTLDICSSAEILEDLLRTDHARVWRGFLIYLKEQLVSKAGEYGFEIYKFTGDGWILLFSPEVSFCKVLEFLEEYCLDFRERFATSVEGYLETPPSNIGISFGIDEGPLLQITMNHVKEYVGRAITVACRLQRAIKEKDSTPGYKALLSQPVFHAKKQHLGPYRHRSVKRSLPNVVGGRAIRCVKVNLIRSKKIVVKKRQTVSA